MKFLRDVFNIAVILLIVSAPAIFLTSTFLDRVYEEEIMAQKKLFSSEQRLSNEIIANSINEITGEAYRSFKVIAGSDEMQRYIDNYSVENRYELEQLFYRMGKNIDDIDQIRFLSLEGMEQIRVNVEKGLAPFVVAENQLQDKSKKDYFLQAKKNSEMICFSEIDLNVEKGEIEKPYKPVFRISSCIEDEEGNLAGVLVMNYRADRIIDMFLGEDEEYMVSRTLLNQEKDIIVTDREDGFFPNLLGSDLSGFEDGSIYNEALGEEKTSYNYYDGEKSTNYIVKLTDIYIDEMYNILVPSIYIVSEYKDEVIALMNKDSFFDVYNMKSYLYSRFVFLLLVAIIFFYFMLENGKNLSMNKIIADTTNDGVIITDRRNRIIFINDAYKDITGFDFEDVKGKTPAEFKSGRHGESFYKEMWHDINSKGMWIGELWDKRKNGMVYPKLLEIRKIMNRSGSVSNYIGIFKDLSDEKIYRERVENLENYNQLTNLPNFKILKKTMDNEIEHGSDFGLVHILLSNYDNLQLSLGDVEFGDFLGLYAKNFIEAFGQENKISHISERKFVIETSNIEDFDRAEEFIGKLVEYLTQPFDYKGSKVKVDVRASCVSYPRDGRDSSTLLENAELALDFVGSQSDRMFVVFNDEIKGQVLRKLKIQEELVNSLEKREFQIYLQPKVSTETKKATSAEALLRWNNSVLGSVSPGEFIPVAEKTDFIIDIDRYVLNETTKMIRRYHDDFGLDINVSVNISGRSFEKVDVYDMVMDAVWKGKIYPDMLTIEITETILMKNVENINGILLKLRKEGIKVSIDDFGTGFSSLSYLKNLETDELKIDRSFIKDFPETDDGSIAKYISIMAGGLGLKTVAEGAETKEQVCFLEEIGCSYIQGYYYSKPLPADGFIEYVLGAYYHPSQAKVLD